MMSFLKKRELNLQILFDLYYSSGFVFVVGYLTVQLIDTSLY